MQPESCDTLANDEEQVEEWWTKLRAYMDLGDGSEARGSMEGPPPEPLYAGPEPTQPDIDTWEAERQIIDLESREAEQFAEERAREEAQQAEQYAALYQAHEAMEYRDWEQWVVLNTPVVAKRRRVVLTRHDTPAGFPLRDGPGEAVAADIPNDLRNFHLTMRFDQQEAVPEVKPVTTSSSRGRVGADDGFGGELFFRRVHQAWDRGQISDEGVLNVHGHEWLLFFQMARGVTIDSEDQVIAEGSLLHSGNGEMESRRAVSEGRTSDSQADVSTVLVHGAVPGEEQGLAEGGMPEQVPGQWGLRLREIEHQVDLDDSLGDGQGPQGAEEGCGEPQGSEIVKE